jgi:hypothetical protein
MRSKLPLPLLTLAAVALGVPLGAPDARSDGADVEALIGALPEYDERRLTECASSATPVLNEICAVGSDCDEDVRVADFVELYNPEAGDVDLGCFVVSGLDDRPFVGRGQIPPGEVRGFGEVLLGFRIKKADDEISLHRISAGPDGELDLTLLESLPVDSEHAHSYRLPDGGAWQHLDEEQAEIDWPGTFGESNTSDRDEPDSSSPAS